MPTPVDVQNFDSLTAPTSTVPGWTIASGYQVTNLGAGARTSANALRMSTSGSVNICSENTADTNTGKTSFSFAVRVNGTQAGASGTYVIPTFRVIANPTSYASIDCFLLEFVFSGTGAAGTVGLYRRVSNGQTLVGAILSVTYDATNGILFNTWYDVKIVADDPDSTATVISVQIQRPNGDYLTTSSTWSAAQANCMTRSTNAYLTLKANSTAGILLSYNTGATNVDFDSSDYESLAAAPFIPLLMDMNYQPFPERREVIAY